MKKLFTFLTLLTFLTYNEAKCDSVVMQGVILSTMGFSPFDSYPGIVKLRKQLKRYSTTAMDDNCTFSSTWKIVNNRLMLTKIENCNSSQKKRTANLRTLFGNRLQKGMLYADWFTGEIWATKDQPNSWGVMYAASWPSETRLIVEKGIVISVKNFVYPKPVETDYGNAGSLNNFIYSHINWDKFHNLPQHSNGAVFSFDQDENGYLINIKQDNYNHSPETFNKEQMEEINRVLGLLRWPVYYRHGVKVKSPEPGVIIVLSTEMREKFANEN